MEQTFGSPRTIDSQISPRDWKEAWMSCLDCLEQTEGRVYDLGGDDCIILARVRRLLCVASMDDWSLFKVLENNAAVLQLEAESAAEVSLPYAAWLYIAEVQLEETCWTL